MTAFDIAPLATAGDVYGAFVLVLIGGAAIIVIRAVRGK